MIPRLYESTETSFSTYGICPLSDAISCLVTEERNDQYTLEMEYPVSGLFFDEIAVDRIILADAHEGDTQAQPFRIEAISGDIEGVVTISAVHISYQLNWIIIGQNEQSTGTRYPSKFWSKENEYLLSDSNPFSFSTDLDDDNGTVYSYGCDQPTPLRTLLGGMDGSMLDIWGGEFLWDRYTVNLLASRGSDNGVRIAYGKNITGIDWETDMSETYTSVVAYYTSDSDYVEGAIQTLSSDFAFQRTIVVDASSEYDSAPTASDLNTYAAAYVRSNANTPTVSVSIEFVPLWQTEEYKEYKQFEQVGLCDTVHIVYPPLNLELDAKVVKTVYNVLLDRYDSIEISTVKKSLADTIFSMQKEINSL